MKRYTKLLFCCICLYFSISNFHIYAADKDTNTLLSSKDKKFNPVTINYLLEGVETPLKSSKILDSVEDFWDDYTVKLSNKLMYGGIDIQAEIRGYFFSHYEISGRRIESIDSLIILDEELPVINVVYSEDNQEDGYLRKGYRDGIGIDFNYLEQTLVSNSSIKTELYDDTWIIELPSKFNEELYNLNTTLPNANDKTLYLNILTSPISVEEQNELIKKYSYIDSIKISSSIGYSDFKNPLLLIYSPKENISELNKKNISLYGINSEGKAELLDSSIFQDESVEFSTSKNFNKYQYLFIAYESDINVQSEKETFSKNEDIPQPNENTPIENSNSNLDNIDKLSQILDYKDESKVVFLVIACFILGSLATVTLSIILSLRKENLQKKLNNR